MAVLVPLAVASLALTFSPAADKQISQLMMKHDPILHWARRLLRRGPRTGLDRRADGCGCDRIHARARIRARTAAAGGIGGSGDR